MRAGHSGFAEPKDGISYVDAIKVFISDITHRCEHHRVGGDLPAAGEPHDVALASLLDGDDAVVLGRVVAVLRSI